MRYTWMLFLAVGWAAPALAEDGNEDDEVNPYLPGLVAKISDGDTASYTRLLPDASYQGRDVRSKFHSQPARFEMEARGRLAVREPGTYRFHVFAPGKIRVELAGRVVLEADRAEEGWVTSDPVTLEFGHPSLRVHFVATGWSHAWRVYWSSEHFDLEPVPARQVFHDVPPKGARELPDVAQGRMLAHTQRCGACHTFLARDTAPPPAAALDRLSGHVTASWLAAALQTRHGPLSQGKKPTERSDSLPHFDSLDAQAAADLTAFLLQKPPESTLVPARLLEPGDVSRGERLFHSLGCLACHTRGEIGTDGPWSGGDLSAIGDKRSRAFLVRWLDDPAQFNRHHRMPVFDLSNAERADLASYLSTLKADPPPKRKDIAGDAGRGETLARMMRCHACHQLEGLGGRLASNELVTTPFKPGQELAPCEPADSKERGYTPRYALSEDERTLVAEYLRVEQSGDPHRTVRSHHQTSPLLVARLNCLACHSRDQGEGLSPTLLKLAQHDAAYNQLIPALTPPSLTSVGDKLTDEALLRVIGSKEKRQRDYLHVRMPRFPQAQEDLVELGQYFVHHDRLPPNPPDPRSERRLALPKIAPATLEQAGETLLGTAGFNCTSCHAVGSKPPLKSTIAGRGPNLAQLGQRIREPWFYRWCHNPARIMPRMEMPAVTVPVKGILGDDVERQLSAVHAILNKPGFEPKDAGPLRIISLSGEKRRGEQAWFGTDVIQSDGKVYIKPLVVALPNRHNLLFDMETGRLARWWQGDAALQLTKGKSWFWQTAGEDVLQAGFSTPELLLSAGGKSHAPVRGGQFTTRPEQIRSAPGEPLQFSQAYLYEVAPERTQRVRVLQSFSPVDTADEAAWKLGWQRKLEIDLDSEQDAALTLQLVSAERMKQGKRTPDGRSVVFPNGVTLQIAAPPAAAIAPDGTIAIAISGSSRSPATLQLAYCASQPSPAPLTSVATPRVTAAAEIDSVPGFTAQRLPLPAAMMPTALAWGRAPGGQVQRLYIASLEGRVWRTQETLPGAWEAAPLPGDFAAPYGIAVPSDGQSHEETVDVLDKGGLFRLSVSSTGETDASPAIRVTTLASGWGHTDDYHDWAVGLVETDRGYVIALPCQQDKRTSAAAMFRGQVLELTSPTSSQDRVTRLQPLSAGHRFPMGIARNRAGAIFVTDNQGNYNPFNELNHVQPGKHFGFINALDQGRPKPPLTPPAVNIPHPWTRSVNGICFLETPGRDNRAVQDEWGPFTGHLIGCEYDTRRLIRISLERVGDSYQGACYPFSVEKVSGENFLGPISCAVSPTGDLYIGSIRDSGWGGGNNVGEVVRIVRPTRWDALPAGIAAVQATPDGFIVRFTQPVSKASGEDAESYVVESYTRTSTPAYGGPDEKRRVEKIRSLSLDAERTSVTLKLGDLRPGFVYEFRLKNLTGDKSQRFFPAEAYYTLNRVPDAK